ncbi:MAG: glycosyltransferase family 2 protein [Ferruginibacter sp.]
MPEPRISVALCTYNGARYLTEQLESILRQTPPPDEIVICDDRSTEGTVAIIDTFIKEYPGIIRLFINEETLQVKRNFEKALRLCTGDIIFLSDQDDIWKANKVESISRYFKDHPEKNVVFTNAELLDNNSIIADTAWDKRSFNGEVKELCKDPAAMLRQLLLKWNIATGATMALRKKALSRYLPFPDFQNYLHDHLLVLQAAVENTLGFLDESLIIYRLHPEQQIGFRRRHVPPLLVPFYRVLQRAKKIMLAGKRRKEKQMIAAYLKKFTKESFPAGKAVLESV